MFFPRRAVYIIQNWVLAFAILCCTNAQNITNTTLSDGIACANTDATFTCKTIGSSAIAWRSERFIGSGNTAQLIFSFDVDSPGSTRQGIDSTTVATLTRNEPDLNGMRLLESTLRVRIPASSSTPLTVTCVHLDNSIDMSVNFTVLSVPEMVQNAVVVQVPCANSSACVAVVSWSPPSNSQSANVTYYTGKVTVAGAEVFSTTNINAGSNETALSAFYVVPNCTSYDFQNVGWSLVAVNQCGEGPRQDALLLPNPADSIGQVICLPDVDQPTTPSDSSALRPSSMWIVNGVVILALMKDVLFN